MAKPMLQVHIRLFENGHGTRSVTVIETYNDWFDFADYLKQESLARREVTIIEWNYVRSGMRIVKDG